MQQMSLSASIFLVALCALRRSAAQNGMPTNDGPLAIPGVTDGGCQWDGVLEKLAAVDASCEAFGGGGAGLQGHCTPECAALVLPLVGGGCRALFDCAAHRGG